ncbi:DUF2183 domain-containing protein [Parvularcula sp. ZS-1/3]|uniref:DUF2183 domain-containing protein n=1 Tax=Parvularcula mediterranea TaxID=2732508 RepID=A0A7Y3W4T4_9PROT|nr:phosphatase domain-containing protein [Parvularcula mediterranea]NNU15577.1 DUF2183 domain-containing protein [Parvularcula mediterranea]
MSARSTLKKIAHKGLNAAESGLDRFRYDVLHKGEDAQTVILPYRGYRSGERLVLRGRVVESWPHRFSIGDSNFAKLRNMLRLYESDELPGVPLEIELAGETHEVITDDEGYFSLLLDDTRPLPERLSWETARVSLSALDLDPVEAEILAPSADEGLAVITDIDDTLLETGATRLLNNWKRLLIETPEEREVVPGAQELFSTLTGGGDVPVFYVSSSPWNLYGYLTRFMEANGLPKGPKFLRDYGIDDVKFITGAHTDHKSEAVKHLLSLYPRRRFLLVGDDGQKDIDVYAKAAEMFPERIAGVFIRDVEGNHRHGEKKAKLAAMEDRAVRVFVGTSFEQAVPFAEELGFGA